jgi:hypothetical protein
MKTVGNFRRTRFKGLRRTQLAATFVAAAYNMLRVSIDGETTAVEQAIHDWGD